MAILEVNDAIDAMAAELVGLRREFHRIPELGFQEHETSALIAEKLRSMGLAPRTGVAGTGIVALIEGGKPGKTLLLRADIDALPIGERSDAPYKSTHPNAMHACGHDAHIAMMLGATRVLQERRAELRGAVKIVFQPAEEGPGGAQPMIEAGVLENPTVDAAIGCHVWNDLPVGQVGMREGPVMASSDQIEIEIEGQGGHGAQPHRAADAIVAAAHVVTALQTIVSRGVSPLESAVVTIGTIQGGYRHNVIADRVRMTGTVRTFDEALWRQMPRNIETVVTGICAGMGVQGRVEYTRGYPATANDPAMTELVRAAATEALGEEAVVYPERTMGGEDMSYFLRAVPGCFFFVGSSNPAKGIGHPHHHPSFDLDEDALPYGVRVLVASALRYLGTEG